MITIIALILVMVLLIIATTKYNVHPFLTLILAAMVMGFVSGLDGNMVILKVTEGFGNTLKSIGIIIAFGTIIGAYLEKSGADIGLVLLLGLVVAIPSASAISTGCSAQICPGFFHRGNNNFCRSERTTGRTAWNDQRGRESIGCACHRGRCYDGFTCE